MKVSVVVRSKDEADRLRLVLASLSAQTTSPQVVVVDDGSSDHTAAVIAAAMREMNIIGLRNSKPTGRSAAANAGALAASGDIVIFLDGDTLAAPNFVARHVEMHRRIDRAIVRGETWHLRCTRPFLDPETGTPQRGETERVARMSAREIHRSLVTRQQIVESFETIDARGQPGVYPGFGPRKLFELEMHALHVHPDCPVLWVAASGSNQSVSRDIFLEAGGFDPLLTINEHRELALRLCQRGFKMVGSAARSYHMIHRSGWRDPLTDPGWENIFFAAHPTPVVALLPVLWSSFADRCDVPREARITSLPELAAAASRCVGLVGRDAVREAHRRWASSAAA